MKKRYYTFFILALFIIGLASCSIFNRGKKDCGDCPTWSHTVIVDTTVNNVEYVDK
jgi:hypothetical protein